MVFSIFYDSSVGIVNVVPLLPRNDEYRVENGTLLQVATDKEDVIE